MLLWFHSQKGALEMIAYFKTLQISNYKRFLKKFMNLCINVGFTKRFWLHSCSCYLQKEIYRKIVISVSPTKKLSCNLQVANISKFRFTKENKLMCKSS